MDWCLLAGYTALWLVVRSRFIAACFFAYLIAISVHLTYPENFTQNQEILAYLFYSGIYSTLFYYLHVNGLRLPSIAALCMAGYDLIYAVDTYANYDVQTWIWSNHEMLIVVLHVALMCVLIPKCNTIMGSIWHNSFRVFTNMLHGKPRANCVQRSQSKEELR